MAIHRMTSLRLRQIYNRYLTRKHDCDRRNNISNVCQQRLVTTFINRAALSQSSSSRIERVEIRMWVDRQYKSANESNASDRRIRSQPEGIEYGNDDYYDDNNNNPSEANDGNSVSNQASMPTSCHQSTESLSNSSQLSPTRLSDMTSAKRFRYFPE